ncbi:MAG: tetratricopeptide repeat protein [Planctomycetes bacterium]|nr:tetratricopeptide repeat protein [Planctomycetota bacterium]
MRFYEEALSTSGERGKPEDKIAVLVSLGKVHRQIGQPERAVIRYREALDMARRQADLFALFPIPIMAAIACALAEAGDFDMAGRRFEECLRVCRERNLRWVEAIVESAIGDALCEQGKLQDSLQHCEAALVILEGFHYPTGKAATLYRIARTRAALGQVQPALAAFREARQLTRDTILGIEVALEESAIVSYQSTKGQQALEGYLKLLAKCAREETSEAARQAQVFEALQAAEDFRARGLTSAVRWGGAAGLLEPGGEGALGRNPGPAGEPLVVQGLQNRGTPGTESREAGIPGRARPTGAEAQGNRAQARGALHGG